MSRWTTKIIDIIQWITRKEKELTLDERIKLCASNNSFFLTNYEIFDDKHRDTLNYKILNYYLFREIGLETPELFRNRLNEKMIRIMPKYNMMYKAYAEEFNLLENIRLIKEYTIERTNNGKQTDQSTNNSNKNVNDTLNNTSSGSSDSSSNITGQNSNHLTNSNNNDTKHSDYPQSDISVGDYLSTEDLSTSSASQDTTGTNSENKTDNINTNATSKDVRNMTDNTSDDYNLSRNTSNTESTIYQDKYYGLQGYPVDMLMKYLEYVNNVDELIIKDLGDLFMLIY